MKLGDIVKLRVGLNSTRMKKDIDSSSIYNAVDTENDLMFADDFKLNPYDVNEPYVLKQGDLVISLIKEKAAIVSKVNSRKIFNSNFIKAEFDPKVVDPWYLCYLLNESETMKRAKNLRTGTGLGYLHISPELLNSMEINLPSIESQKTIGKAYRRLCRYEYEINKQKGDLKKLIIALIKEQEKKGK